MQKDEFSIKSTIIEFSTKKENFSTKVDLLMKNGCICQSNRVFNEKRKMFNMHHNFFAISNFLIMFITEKCA